MGSLAKGSLRKVCRNSADFSFCSRKFEKIRFIASGKGAEILLGLGFRRAHFSRIFIFEKSWSKCKHAFQPKDVTMDAHMLSLSMSA